MQITNKLALGAASLGLALAQAPVLSQAQAATNSRSHPVVSVRVEGLRRTLLDAAAVKPPTSGYITKGGTPKGACSAATVAGALNWATGGHWAGKWDANYNALEVTSILRETHRFTSPAYWSIWIDGRYAPAGVCGLKLHSREQILFAAVSNSFSGYPLLLRVPRQARMGRVMTATAGYYGKSGFVRAVGVHIRAATLNLVTNKRGQVRIPIKHKGVLVVHGYGQGYIRAGAVRVREVP